jgi:hypothetical protein
MKPIPVKAAELIAKSYGYDQVVVIARKVGEDGGEHVTTYGVDEANCAVAARIGVHLKEKVMLWPRDAHDAKAEVAQAIANKMMALGLRIGGHYIASLIHVREMLQVADAAIEAYLKPSREPKR